MKCVKEENYVRAEWRVVWKLSTVRIGMNEGRVDYTTAAASVAGAVATGKLHEDQGVHGELYTTSMVSGWHGALEKFFSSSAELGSSSESAC